MRSVRSILGLCIFLQLAFAGCVQRSGKSPDQEQINAIFSHADSLGINNLQKLEPAYIDSMFNTFPYVTDEILFQKYDRLAGHANGNGMRDKAILYLDTAIGIVKRHDLKDSIWANLYLRAHVSKGFIQFQIGKGKEAVENFFEAGKMAANVNCGNLQLVDHYTGLVLYKEKKFRDAMQSFVKAIKIIDACPDKKPSINEKTELLNDVALCYTELKIEDSARVYYRKAINYLDSVRRSGLLWYDSKDAPKYYQIQKGVILGNIGQLFATEKKRDSAEVYFKNSIAINSAYTLERGNVQSRQLDLANLYLDDGMPGKARVVLRELKRSIDTFKNEPVAQGWKKAMVRLTEQQGNYVDALNYYRSFVASQDSLDSLSSNSAVSDLATVLRTKSQDLEIKFLKKTNEFNRIYLLITLALILFSVIIIGLVNQSYRKSRKNIQILTGLNDQISRQKAELEAANREKDRILNVVAHDLRSPVGMVASLADLTLMDEDLSEGTKKSLAAMKTTTAGALALVDEILKLKDDEPGEEEKQPADINKLVKSSIAMISFQATEKHQQIVFSPAQNPIMVKVVSHRIVRMMNNLIHNAIKFSPPNSQIFVSVSASAGAAVIAIKDSGIGIPDKLKGNIFDVFSPSRQKGTSGERSYGLGLSICKKIAEGHGGKITFESEARAGSTFYVTIPLHDQVDLVL